MKYLLVIAVMLSQTASAQFWSQSQRDQFSKEKIEKCHAGEKRACGSALGYQKDLNDFMKAFAEVCKSPIVKKCKEHVIPGGWKKENSNLDYLKVKNVAAYFLNEKPETAFVIYF